ncbi:Aste57867_14829 [Aphanomyces stellatus]|uniref:Aste57867_14829 protein n=1 Tax=Aphanomyces stellatus TaxID=120398 RepID=A0A485L2I6_9STRA|nr:hypothetical protein As57867_014773 [Aphanomyces stellatus]VFT91647.1 Aste57867_14829 [Aphanomyces stellatus]
MHAPTTDELVDVDTAALVAIIDARKESRINRRRTQKKAHYQHDKRVYHYLKTRAIELENELGRLTQLPRATLMSWKETAAALRDETSLHVHNNRVLKKRLREFHTLARLMQSWVDTAIEVRHPPCTPQQAIYPQTSAPTATWSASNLSLNHIRLHAHLDARRHGLDWLTQIMYHNTDRMLEKYAFPPRSPHSRLGDVLLDDTGGLLQYVQRYQVEIPLPLDQVLPRAVAYFQTGATPEQLEVHYKSKRYLDVEVTQSLSRHMSYDVVVDLTSYGDAGDTRLCRVFGDDQRFVLVTQNIPEDERLPSKSVDSKSMNWVVVERVGPSRTILRCLFVVSQGIHRTDHIAGQVLSLEEESRRDWNLDLKCFHEHDRLDVFRRHVLHLGYRNMQSRDQDFARLFRCEI